MASHLTPEPPRWARRFLEWYCRPDRIEEIYGDALELYGRTLREGKRKADLQFVWNVLRFFRWRNIKALQTPYTLTSPAMLKNYLIIGSRNALRNGITSVLNVGGLALGVAGTITIFIFTDQFFHSDNFHLNRERIYQVTNVINRENRLVTLSDVPILLGPSIKEDFPGVEGVTRAELGFASVRNGDKVFSERLWYVDPDFLTLFTFPFISGHGSGFGSGNQVVLTKEIAEKYFGHTDVAGKTLSVKFPNNRIEEVIVAGVVDPPLNNTMYFGLLAPMNLFFRLGLQSEYRWDYLTDVTFVMMKPGHGIDELRAGTAKYKVLQNESSPEWLTESFNFYPFTSLATRGYEIESYMVGSGHPQGPVAVLVIAIMLLVLACFNYMNISVATVANRLKEIGIRKSLGGRKKEILTQFITENALLCSVSIGLGLLISHLFFMPGLISILGYAVPFGFSSGRLGILFFAGLLLFIVVLSGVYPALYVTQFEPVTILKGKQKFGQRSWFSRSLLTFQFMLAFTVIVGCFLFIDNDLYLSGKDWGYDHDQNIVVPVADGEQYLKLRDHVVALPDVLSFAGGVDHVGYPGARSVVEWRGKRYEVQPFRIGFGYLETMNMRLASGRFFDRAIETDRRESVIINETFARTMGWDTSVDQTFAFDSVRRTVIGVVKDFHHADFYQPILPVVFLVGNEGDFNYLVAKARGGRVIETEARLRESWKEIVPDDPYGGSLQDEMFANFRRNAKTNTRLLGFIAAMSVVLACLGLFGLVSYNITRRLKEFSIRKIFGATTVHIFGLMNRDHGLIILLSFAIGAPCGFLLMDGLIRHVYVFPQPARTLPFALALSIMLVTVLLTVVLQLFRVARENPADTLRAE